ncbi:MAG: SpaH/EbpB family LPXTG-anchored major pilin [Arcanobacterium sp.]
MMKRKSTRWSAAVAALAVAGLGFTAPALGDVDDVTVNPNADTNLVIHKYEGPHTTAANCEPNGTELPATCFNGDGLEGAEFAIYKVQYADDEATDVNLATNKGWDAARAYYDSKAEPTNKTLVDTVTTLADGTATYSATNGDGVGLYWVKEVTPPSPVDGKTYSGSVSFFVTVPMTDPVNGNSWMYDVHVYPKNDAHVTPHKAALDESGIYVNAPITYRVSSVIPNYGDVVGPVDGNGNYTGPDNLTDYNDLPYYFVRDTFSTDLNISTPAVSDVWIVAADADPTLDTTPRIVTLATTDYDVAVSGQTVTVSILDSGLTKMAENYGAQLVVDFETTLKSVPTNGLIENQAGVIPAPKPSEGDAQNQQATVPANPVVPEQISNTVTDKYGIIEIYKVGVDGDSETPLKDVTFEVYQAKKLGDLDDNGIFDDYEYSCAPADMTGMNGVAANAAGVQPLSTIVTDADGYGASGPLQLSTWYNDGVEKLASGTPGGNDGYFTGAQHSETYGPNKYCLVETKAADGYELLAEPVLFELTTAGTAKIADVTDAHKIVNQPANKKLPLTGGQGIVVLSVLGVLLIGGGSAFYAFSSRKRKEVA